MPAFLTKFLIGRPLANREAGDTKLRILEGVPAMGLDGLGSAAYGPEAALTVLAGTGAAGLAAIGPITWVILLLLAILYFSYRQTIAAYPTSGGSYTVAKENLGTSAGLLAAAALMLDYMLNVAVGISAGVGALTSAVPPLHAYTLWICLVILLAITVLNLRGTRESGLIWSVPTYLFIASLGFVLAWGAWKAVQAGGHPEAVIPPPSIPPATQPLAIWLLLRAFASGCTAMTGVEAVSNGVSAFREPKVRHAHGTLTVIVVVLGLLLLGIAYLAQAYGIAALDQTKGTYQSVLSQLVSAVYGRGWFYYVTIGSVLTGTVPFRQYELRRVSQPLPDGRAGRVSPARLRHARTPPGLFGRRPVPRSRGGSVADRLRGHHRPPHPTVRDRGLLVVHPLPGRDGRALAPGVKSGCCVI